MTCTPPWALFIIDEDIDVPYINNSLKRAYDGSFADFYQLWVATSSYADVPKDRLNYGTEPTLPSTYRSPWINKTVEDCARWLQSVPKDSPLNQEYFTVLNEYSKEDDTVLVCRINQENGWKVEYFPQSTDEVAMQMHTNDGTRFDVKASGYQNVVGRLGKPDRSRAGPFN